MDRNSIYGILVIGIIIVVFSIWTSSDKKKMEEEMRKADSIAQVEQKHLEEKNLSQKKIQSETIAAPADSLKLKTEHLKNLKNIYGAYANVVEGKKEFYTIENNLVKITFLNKGGRPYCAELKKYKTFDKKPLILFNGDSTIFGLNFSSQSTRIISTNDLYFQLTGKKNHIFVNQNDTSESITLRLNLGSNKYIEYIYKLNPESYMMNFSIHMINMDSIIPQNSSTIDLKWKFYMLCQEKTKTTESNYTSIDYKFYQADIDKFDVSAKKSRDSINLGRLNWLAYKQQFFSSVLIANKYFENATLNITNIADSSRILKTFDSYMGIPYESKPDQTMGFKIYFGPNKYTLLKNYGQDLEELVSMGSWRIIKWINRWFIIPIFNFLNNYTTNYGLIILLLTIIIKILLFPLSYKSYLSMAKMRVLKPQIDEINERIPKDKAMERQQATMALYKKAGVNPMGGCFPMLLQMPILIAMFRFFPTSIELRQQGFLWAHDLSSYDAIFSWSAYIPIISQTFGNHISLFNLLMTITTVITIRMSNQANVSSQQMPGMQFVSYLMPFMFMFVLNNFSSGLTYYYFLVNLITIVQNEIFKRSIDEAKILHQLNENKKKPVKKSKFQEKLEQASKRKGYSTKR
jgi:YidC/Oxa1 family membrane protein insertase